VAGLAELALPAQWSGRPLRCYGREASWLFWVALLGWAVQRREWGKGSSTQRAPQQWQAQRRTQGRLLDGTGRRGGGGTRVAEGRRRDTSGGLGRVRGDYGD
jgi:hypothetical protein